MGGPLSEQFPTSGSSAGSHRPEQAVVPGASGPVPGRPDFTPGPESTSSHSEPLIEPNRAPDPTPDLPRLQQPRRGRRLAKKPEEPAGPLTAEQRLLVLDAWQRSGLPARDFAPLVGMSRHTLYAWKCMQLHWLPAMDESAATAVAALGTLFRQHGAPLVLKSDNGSAFIAKETQRLLAKWHIWH